METNITSPKLRTDHRARALMQHLLDEEGSMGIESGVLYYGFPVFRDSDDVMYRSEVLLASRSHGLAIFEIPDFADRATPDQVRAADSELTQLYTIIYGKILKSRLLRHSMREIKVPIQGFLVLTDVRKERVQIEEIESTPAFTYKAIDDSISVQKLDPPLSEDEWNELRAIIEGAKGIVRAKDRDLTGQAATSKGVILSRLEAEIANFDQNQRRAALALVDGPQRIRGLAGTGKTIVLAMKAAHIHLDDPNATVLVTFWTKSLYGIIRRLITKFYRQFNDRDPDWNKVHVLHAWGGRNVDGVYYNACVENGVKPETVADVGKGGNAFAVICDRLSKTRKVRQKYDFVLIDEAQDLPVPFFRLCYELTKGEARDRNIVWAYDELQNIMNVHMRSPDEMFGLDAAHVPLISLDRAAEGGLLAFNHDIVLRKSYRNPREILVVAHAIGFAVYSDTIVQMLENKEHWQDVGYLVEQGDCVEGQFTVITRPEENSPLSISETQASGEIISTFVANSIDEEVAWVVKTILEFKAEGLRADDIMVISLDDFNAKSYFQLLARGLAEHDIKSLNVLSNPFGAPAFALADHVTLSTVYRAKGNEAAVVFTVGVDAIHPDRKQQRARNKRFTAFTRAKAWLRVSGIGDEARYFVNEIEVARSKLPRLEFVYPDPAKVKLLQRDLSDKASRLRDLAEETERRMEQLGLEEEERELFLSTLSPRKK
jgi:superfamily I DNA and RNA helicase